MPITTIPKPALVLGLAGLIPFFGLCLLSMMGEARADAALLSYGAVILSFMGGCRWGFAAAGVGEGPDWKPLAVAVLPALYAWGVIAWPLPMAELWLAAGFAVLYIADANLTAYGGAPAWWNRLRLPLTIGAVLALGLAAFSR